MISWESKKQSIVSRSLAEAEYQSLTAIASELTWLESLLTDFHITLPSTVVYYDSQAAIHIASNLTYHERMKHIKIDCHFVREKVGNGTITLVHVQF